MKYKAIIYDIDGTLLDTLAMNFYPLIEIIKEEKGIEMTYEEAIRYAPYPGVKTLELLGIEDIDNVYPRWVSYVNAYPEKAKAYDGVEELLEKVKIQQAIVSAKTKEQYEIDFVSQGYGKYIDVAILKEDTEKHKPDPEPLLECVRRLGIKPEEAIYIGDAFSDYQAAMNAGMDFGYAIWKSPELEDIPEKYILKHPLDILKMIGQEND